jgi:hypothetical protein
MLWWWERARAYPDPRLTWYIRARHQTPGANTLAYKALGRIGVHTQVGVFTIDTQGHTSWFMFQGTRCLGSNSWPGYFLSFCKASFCSSLHVSSVSTELAGDHGHPLPDRQLPCSSTHLLNIGLHTIQVPTFPSVLRIVFFSLYANARLYLAIHIKKSIDCWSIVS